LIGQLGRAQLVHGDSTLDRERPLHQALLVHLAGEERHAEPTSLLRDAERDPEGERRLARADVASQHDQVPPAQPAAQQAVDRREAGRDRVARDLAGALLIHPCDQRLRRGGEVAFQSTWWHRYPSFDCLPVYPSGRLPV